jgi:hypothetical protein
MAFNMGVLIHFHFCGNTFHHLSIIAEPDDCCEGENNSCCHNSSFDLTLDDDYDSDTISSIATEIKFISNIPIQQDMLQYLIPCSSELPSLHHAGPLIQSAKRPIYLTNRVFLI